MVTVSLDLPGGSNCIILKKSVVVGFKKWSAIKGAYRKAGGPINDCAMYYEDPMPG